MSRLAQAGRADDDRRRRDAGRADRLRLSRWPRPGGPAPTEAGRAAAESTSSNWPRIRAHPDAGAEAARRRRIAARTTSSIAAELAAWTMVASMILNLDETITKELKPSHGSAGSRTSARLLTRRQLLRPHGHRHRHRGLGFAAESANCFAGDTPAMPRRPARRRHAVGLPHFAPTAKRVIYLFSRAGRRTSTCSTTSRKLHEHHGQELPDSRAHGPAASPA